MHNQEDRVLKGYMDEVRAKAASMPDDKLDDAVRQGIERGKLSPSPRRRNRIFTAAAVLAAAVILLWSGVWQPQAERTTGGPFPPLTVDLSKNPELSQFNEKGLIQPVGRSTVKGDYKLTVDGVIAGSQQLKVLYTVEHSLKKPVMVLDTIIKDPVTNEPYKSSAAYGGGNAIPAGIHSFDADYVYEESQEIPENLILEVKIAPYSSEFRYSRDLPDAINLEVSLKLDLKTYQKLVRTIPIQQTLEVEGQKILIREAVLSAAGMVLKVTVDPANTLEIKEMNNVYLEAVKGGFPTLVNSWLSYYPDDKGEADYYFRGAALYDTDSITLKAVGLEAVDPEKLNVVVDLKKGELLEVQVDGLEYGGHQLDQDREGNEVNTLTFNYVNKDKEYVTAIPSFERRFVDGEGHVHEMGDYISSGSIKEAVISLKIEPLDYPQPLTFSLYSYPNVLEKKIEVPIQ
ncbi:DUF4179 domain-containing protein [Paenibacillus lemnae]|uniref:DUF4179 domain-containing protein n=1 Tax=Paenibacillus lemnae TaxID=1330551 RepID=A0A848MA12_PAELE|nr:DUF4179 domain-containing protein [Paenibacillus lemnae]NMO96324.1 DUF4179 domain-containing protein [Paenibacillus lemnae]